jgi:protease-4
MDAIERDFYEERRRKWRRSAFWKGFLVAAVLALILGAIFGSDDLMASRDHVARVNLTGVIVDDEARNQMLADLAEAEHARALILRINSPGGTTVGSEAIFEAVRVIAETRPVVAVMGEVAASGGYIAGIAADHIVARGNTITGSIGVIMEYPDFTEVLDVLGIGIETVRSSELKAEPSPFRPTNPAARARDELMIAESYDWFRDLVGERRDLDGNALSEVANGGIFSGRMALELGLIDEIGGEPQAVVWLESREAGLGDLPVRDWEIERETSALGAIIGALGANSGILEEISRLRGGKLYSIGP